MHPSPLRSEYKAPSIDGLSGGNGQAWPVEICLFGGFRLLRSGEPVTGRAAGKLEGLILTLALGSKSGVPREVLLNQLWPDSDTTLAGQSLNSLVYSLRRLVAEPLANKAPVLTDAGMYRLNLEAGISVDVSRFDALLLAADRRFRANDRPGASELYAEAVELYRGDLCIAGVPSMAIERERLRASFLTALARLANYHLLQGDARSCLTFAQALLHGDPCREDALRLVMRCFVRLGERAQAMRQFRLSEAMLRDEFAAEPEPATVELWEQVRLHPECV
jgi:DNA-binding SARP family transcriptional activator